MASWRPGLLLFGEVVGPSGLSLFLLLARVGGRTDQTGPASSERAAGSSSWPAWTSTDDATCLGRKAAATARAAASVGVDRGTRRHTSLRRCVTLRADLADDVATGDGARRASCIGDRSATGDPGFPRQPRRTAGGLGDAAGHRARCRVRACGAPAAGGGKESWPGLTKQRRLAVGRSWFRRSRYGGGLRGPLLSVDTVNSEEGRLDHVSWMVIDVRGASATGGGGGRGLDRRSPGRATSCQTMNAARLSRARVCVRWRKMGLVIAPPVA
jgi:hypothetical protein